MENEEFGLEQFTDAIEMAVTGIPAPVRKNFFKAFGQLCTAAVDVPVTWLEGKASEIKATSEARIKIIQQEGKKISESIDVPAQYIQKASEKFASKIIREQINLDDITYRTAKELSANQPKDNQESTKEAPPISDEWLNKFEQHARVKSSEEMKIIFSKILSGEIKQPGSFSMRTVELISQLDNQAAKIFQNLCNITSGMYLGDYLFDARVVSLSGNAASNSLSEFGLNFSNLNVLQEYGLIISDYNSYIQYAPIIANDNNQVAASLKLGNKFYGFLPKDRSKYDAELKVNGVGLTNAGRELYKIIPQEQNLKYFDTFKTYFDKKGFDIISASQH